MERAQGRDEGEMAREREQRAKQEERIGSWGGARPSSNGAGRKGADGLLGYTDLYALWERQNWRASELDFSVDREQWVTTPSDSQVHTTWSLGSFYIGEERVTADGFQALNIDTTGQFNTATGAHALLRSISGENNVANGFEALGSNTTGGANTAIGSLAFTGNSTGNNNTALGASAGKRRYHGR